MSLKRIKNVQKMFSEWGVDAFIVTDPVDLFYLSGMKLSLGTMVVTKKTATLVVDSRYFEKCQKEAACDVALLSPTAVGSLLKSAKTIGFSQETVSYATFKKLEDDCTGRLVPLAFPMQKIRAIKDSDEVKALEKAIELCFEGIDFALSMLKVGVTEAFVAKELHLFWLKKGGEKLSFDSIIAFGKNSSMPHYRAANCKLKRNDIVLIDVGVVVDGYASDMTRTFFFGTPDKRLEEIYNVVLEAQEKSVKAVRPGLSAAKLYEVSKKVIDKAGFGDNYLHGLGHGIGLETHEFPTLRATSKDVLLAPGMCITIEPGIYLPNLGGVRIEDMVLVTKDGHKNLTEAYPKKLTVLKVG